MGTLRSIAVLSAALATAFPGIALSQASPQSVSSGTTIAQQFPTSGTNNNGINNNNNGTLNNGSGVNNNGTLNNNSGVNNNDSLNNNNGVNNNGSLNNNNGVNNNGINNNGTSTGVNNGVNNGTNDGRAIAPGSLLTQPQGTSGTSIAPGVITYPSGGNTGGAGVNGDINTQGTGTGTGVNGTGINNTGVNGTGVNNTGVNGTGVNNTGVNGTGINGTGVNGTGVNNTGVNGTGVNQGAQGTPVPGTIQVLPGSNPQIIQVVPSGNPQASLPALPYNATGTLDAELLRATCNQNWQGAMNIVTQAIAASPENAAYRSQLYQYRSRLQTLRDANVRVPNWSAQCTGG